MTNLVDELRRYRPGVSDIAPVAAYVVVAAFFTYLSFESPLTTPLIPVALLTVAGLATIPVIRVNPVVGFGVATLLMLVSFAFGTGAEAVLVAVAILTAGSEKGAKVAWAMFGITAGLGLGGAAILTHRMHTGPPLWGMGARVNGDQWIVDAANILFFIVFFALVVTLFAVNLGHRRRLASNAADRDERIKRESLQQASITRAEERDRIAREMHDVIAHSLAVMISVADGAQAIAIKRPEEAQQAIGRVAETGRRTLDEVRHLLGSVRQGDVALSSNDVPQPGLAELPVLIEEFVAAGLPVQFTQTGSLAADRVLGLTIYRIIQESLTNVLRHANKTTDVQVVLTLGEPEVDIVVQDTSSPATAAIDPGRGLVGMRERAAYYNGTVQAGKHIGGGWRVHARLEVGDHDRD